MTDPAIDPKVLEVEQVIDTPMSAKTITLAEDAFQGLAGEIVRAVEPHTESDPAALLMQLVVVCGAYIGSEAYSEVEATRHYPNEFLVIVGRTSKARKGTGYDHIKRVFDEVNPGWLDDHELTGIASGEGVLEWMSDDAEPRRDRELLIMEPELVTVLNAMNRKGSNLSAHLRNLWDHKRLKIIRRQNPIEVTDAHSSIIAHITPEELLQQLSSSDCSNGLANRFLYCLADRARLLPEGGNFSIADIRPQIDELRSNLQWARSAGFLQRTDPAKALWRDLYHEMSQGEPGMLGKVTDRGEPHILRLSMIYALLERKTCVEPHHLEAATAVWMYSLRSAREIFGDRTGNELADKIAAELECRYPSTMTTTDIHGFLQRNSTSKEIGEALKLLLQHNRIGEMPPAGKAKGRVAKRYISKHTAK